MRGSGGLLAVALSALLVGCALIEVQLLTGGEEVCSIRAGAPTDIRGLLVADSESGTAIEVDQRQEFQWPALAGRTVSVRWPTGYTGRRTLSGAVEVLNAAGEVVAVTGTHVGLGLQFDGGPTGPDDAFPACAVASPAVPFEGDRPLAWLLRPAPATSVQEKARAWAFAF